MTKRPYIKNNFNFKKNSTAHAVISLTRNIEKTIDNMSPGKYTSKTRQVETKPVWTL